MSHAKYRSFTISLKVAVAFYGDQTKYLAVDRWTDLIDNPNYIEYHIDEKRGLIPGENVLAICPTKPISDVIVDLIREIEETQARHEKWKHLLDSASDAAKAEREYDYQMRLDRLTADLAYFEAANPDHE